MKKDDRVTVRLPDDLQNFQAYGFRSVTDYIKAALTEFNEKQEFEIAKANEILSKIADLVTIMEAQRDHSGDAVYPENKERLIASLYQAAREIAGSEMVKSSPINNGPYPEELKDGEDHPTNFYKHTWAL